MAAKIRRAVFLKMRNNSSYKLRQLSNVVRLELLDATQNEVMRKFYVGDYVELQDIDRLCQFPDWEVTIKGEN